MEADPRTGPSRHPKTPARRAHPRYLPRSPGVLQIRAQLSNDGATGGVNQIVGRNLPNKGIFQRIAWDITIRDGRIARRDLDMMRFKAPQLRLLASNVRAVDPARPEHQPYPPQPPLAALQPEVVGDDPLEQQRYVERLDLLKNLGRVISKVGCLDCHDQGSKDLARFFDDGIPMRPAQDVPTLISLAVDPSGADWKRYPAGMSNAVQRLSREAGLVPLLRMLLEKENPARARPGGAAPEAP